MSASSRNSTITSKRAPDPLSFLALAQCGPTIPAGGLSSTTPRRGSAKPEAHAPRTGTRHASTKRASRRVAAFAPDTLQGRVIQFAREHGGRISARDVAAAGPLTNADAGRAVYRLVLQGVLASTGDRVRGDNGLLAPSYSLGQRAVLTTDVPAAPILATPQRAVRQAGRHARVLAVIGAAGELTPQQYCAITGGKPSAARASFAVARRAGLLRIVRWERADAQAGFDAVHVLRAADDATPDAVRPRGYRALPLYAHAMALLAEQRTLTVGQLAAHAGAAMRTARVCIATLRSAGFIAGAVAEDHAHRGRRPAVYTLTGKSFTVALTCS